MITELLLKKMRKLIQSQFLNHPFFNDEDISESPAELTPGGQLLRKTPFNRGNDLGRFVGAGTFGVVFELGDGSLVIKIEKTPPSANRVRYMMDLNRWASNNNVGPKFDSWGKLSLPKESFAIMHSIIGTKSPKWLKNPSEGDTYIYSIFEKWADGTLHNYIRNSAMGTPTERLRGIPVGIMVKFKDKIRKLHARKVVHLDLSLKNILVKLDAGVIVDMALSDFGAALPREAWFFGITKQARTSTVDHFSKLEWAQELVHQFNRKYPGNFQKWIMMEPFNADWCVFFLYVVYAKLQSAMGELTKPVPYFNFDIPFSSQGWIKAKVTDGNVQVEVSVYGLMSAADLRKVLERSHPNLIKRTVFETIDRSLISRSKESSTFASKLLQYWTIGYVVRLRPETPDLVSV